MRLFSLLLVPAIALAAACGGSNEPPAAPTPPPAPSAAPVDTSAPAASAAPVTPPPADTSAAVDAGPPPAPAASAGPTLPPVPAPPKPWPDMSHDERMKVMKEAVLPNMKTAFQGFDAKHYTDFSCKTCHADVAGAPKAKKFAMPNAALPKLDFKNKLQDDVAKHPEAVKFMHEVVVPQMATMLGVAPFDMKTMTGFGCGGCHTSK